jgi:hypothetical protein
MPLVFISYAPKDHEIGENLAGALKQRGIDSISSWHDQDLADTTNPADSWKDQVESALHKCDAGIVLASPASLRSMVVAHEAWYFIMAKKPLFPVIITPVRDAVFPPGLRGLPRFSLGEDLGGIDKLVDAINHLTGASGRRLSATSEQGFLPGKAQITVKLAPSESDQTQNEVVSLVDKLARAGFQQIDVVSAKDDNAE